MNWWKVHSALLKYLLAFEHCSQEIQQRRTAGERQLGKDASLHQTFGCQNNPGSQGTWPEAIWCRRWGDGQPSSVNTTRLFCYSSLHIPFSLSGIGRLLEHASQGVVDLQHPSQAMVHTWYHQKNSGRTTSAQLLVSGACISVKSGFWQTHLALNLQTIFRSLPSFPLINAFRALSNVVWAT